LKKKLWLCHTRTLLKQAASDFHSYGLTGVSICTEGEVDLSGDIVLATRQTFINIDPDEYADLFDIVIIDEVHHIPDEYAEYSRILNNLLAPVRGGVTATYPGGRAARLAIEGFVGRVVGEFSIEEAIEKGILAKPNIKVIRTKMYTDIKELKKYKDVVDQGIIHNEDRNELIVRAAGEYMKQGKSVLILVNLIDHGENLLDIAKELGLNIIFIQGATDSTKRESLRHALHRKEILGVIATAVWKEGVNIPSLDVILLAHIGKKELTVLQAVGRGMRSTETKTTVTIVDIFDPSHFHLIKHFGYRLSYYCERGWM
jgi:superfamily II DNA or RNA helicase